MANVHTYPLTGGENNFDPQWSETEITEYLRSGATKPFIFQQSFLGASITDFSLSLGYNGNASTLSVSLIEDHQNLESKLTSTGYRDGVTEGYHPWDRSAYPITLLMDNGRHNLTAQTLQNASDRGLMSTHVYRRNNDSTLPGGDKFAPPHPGEPVYFKYYDGSRLTEQCISNEQPDGGHTCAAKGVLSATNPEAAVFEFNGIIKEYKREWGASGETFSISIEDPRSILENTTVILDTYQGRTATPDAHLIAQHHKLPTGSFQRRFDEGFSGFYNVINVFGYYEEGFGFGASGKEDRGVPWFDTYRQDINLWGAKHQHGILPALQFMLGAFEDGGGGFASSDKYIADKEPYGGPLYYSNSTVMMKGIDTYDTLGEPVGWSYTNPEYAGVRRYVVDLSALYNLSARFNPNTGNPLKPHGILPDDFKIGGGSMSLLQIIQSVCTAAGCDFFVELHVPRSGTGIPHLQRQYERHKHKAGIIRIVPIPKNSKIKPGIIKYLLDRTLNWQEWGESDGGPWADKIISANVGYSHQDPLVGIFTVGAPLTRMVGVTHLGGEIGARGQILGSKRKFDFFHNSVTGAYYDPAHNAPLAYPDSPDRDDLLRDDSSFLELDGVVLQTYDQPYFGIGDKRWPLNETDQGVDNHFKDYNADWAGQPAKPGTGSLVQMRDGEPDFVDNDEHYAQPLPISKITGGKADSYFFNIPWSKNTERVIGGVARPPLLQNPAPGLRGVTNPEGDYPMDGFIDLYPCWGFEQNQTREIADGFGQVIQSVSEGDPIKGMFIDDDPYRDFQPMDGLFAAGVFWNPAIGECKTKPKCTKPDPANPAATVYATRNDLPGGDRCWNEDDCLRAIDFVKPPYCRNKTSQIAVAPPPTEAACNLDPDLEWIIGEENPGCNAGNSTWQAGLDPATTCDNMPEICMCDPDVEDEDNECKVARNGHPVGCDGVFFPDCHNFGICQTGGIFGFGGEVLVSSLAGVEGDGMYFRSTGGTTFGTDSWTCQYACFKVLNQETLPPVAIPPLAGRSTPNTNAAGDLVGDLIDEVPILYINKDGGVVNPGGDPGNPVTSNETCKRAAEFPKTGTHHATRQKIPKWTGEVFPIDCAATEPSMTQCVPIKAPLLRFLQNEFTGNSEGPYAKKCTHRNHRDRHSRYCADITSGNEAVAGKGSHQLSETYAHETAGMTFNSKKSCENVEIKEFGIKIVKKRNEVGGAGTFQWIGKDWGKAIRKPHDHPDSLDPDLHNPFPGYIHGLISLEGVCDLEPEKWKRKHDCIANGGKWDEKFEGGNKGLPVRPRTATIPVYLGDAHMAYQAGPDPINIDRARNFYFATVTELRHAAVGQDNYYNYLKEYQPYLTCYYCHAQAGKWCDYCPTKNVPAINPNNSTQMSAMTGAANMGNRGKNVIDQAMLNESGNSGKAVTAQGIPCGRDEVPELTEYDKSLITMSDVFKKVQDIATKYYGRKYLMALPFNPPTVIGCSNPNIDNKNDCEQVVGTCENHTKPNVPPDPPPADEAECVDEAGTWVERGGFDWGAAGIRSEWFRKMGIGRCSDSLSPDKATCEQAGHFWMEPLKIEQKWDIASSAWPGGAVDFTFDDAKNMTYPQNMNFWTADGNLESFAVYPRKEYRRLKQDLTEINWGDVDAEGMHISPHNIGMKAYGDNKVFLKTQVDPKTYWLKTRPFWEVANSTTYVFRHPDQKKSTDDPKWIAEEGFTDTRLLLTRDNEEKYGGQDRVVDYAFLKPYALITIPNPPRYGNVDVADVIEEMGDFKICIPLIHHKNSNCLQAGWPRAVSAENMAMQNLTAIANNQEAFPSIAPDGSRSQLIDAAYKPFGAAVPQQSTRYTWGPWAIGRGFGKVEYKQDTSLHPASFGSEEAMDDFVLKKNALTLNRVDAVLETGSVNLAGLPAYHVGTQIMISIDSVGLHGFPQGAHIYPGPYVTDVSVSVGTGGVSTTYNLTTARKFGDLSQQNEERIKGMQSDILTQKKDMEDFIKSVRRDLLAEAGRGID